MNSYCNHIYDYTTDGYIQVFNIGSDKKIKVYSTTVNSLCDVVEEVEKKEDVFITPNTFYKPQRQVNNIRQFRALFIDIDKCEKDKHYVAYKIFEMVEENKIPKPTMIVDSGRGLHIYWRIKNAPYGALDTWQELEDYFYTQLKSLGADKKATDGARVLRLPGTMNSRAGVKCAVIWQDEEKEYSMYDLREEYLKDFYKKAIAKVKKNNPKIINNLFFNSYSLHKSRAEDLETLVNLRNGYMKGSRNMALHCYAYWKGIYNRDEQELRSIVESFNNNFKPPLKVSEVNAVLRCVPKAIDKFLEYEQGLRLGTVKRVTKGMKDKGGYWYKNETLIERLEISESEQKHLKTIIGTNEKYHRNNLKRTPRNENGLTKKQQELQDIKNRVIEFKKKGYNNTQIAKELDINRTKVIRLLKEI